MCACVDECVIEKEEKKESKLMCFRESAQECLCLSAWVNEMRMSAHERKRERERDSTQKVRKERVKQIDR